jgi:hypothetical protein
LAAIGWVELGNPAEASQELNRISDTHRSHLDVLEAECRIHAATKSWRAALQVARKQIQTANGHPVATGSTNPMRCPLSRPRKLQEKACNGDLLRYFPASARFGYR